MLLCLRSRGWDPGQGLCWVLSYCAQGWGQLLVCIPFALVSEESGLRAAVQTAATYSGSMCVSFGLAAIAGASHLGLGSLILYIYKVRW